ncbi:MAG: L-threonylcarbamoyladenylate synthase [Bacteroidia bacterium]
MIFPLLVYLHIAETGKNTTLAADLLLKGELVAIPTETVYGLAANALNEKAVLAIFEAKQRPHFDPLIIHVPDIASAAKYADLMDERLKKLATLFWPGPLTLLLPKKDVIPSIVTSGLEQVAVRVPDHPLTLELLKQVSVPLAAPSANPFGYVSPTAAVHVEKQLGNKVAYILDGGACSIGLESTIVGVEEGNICVYRLGGLPIEEIEKVVGKVELRINNSGDPKAPGQLKSHYAPKKPLFIGQIGSLLKENRNKKIAVLSFGEKEFPKDVIVFNLSKSRSLNEAALNLFKFLREADESEAEIVITDFLPEEGLGRAINDRLKRASC